MTTKGFVKIPQHVGLIMDGNMRWAKAQGKEYIEGLRAGAEVIQPIVERAGEVGIKNITFWALSTENWRRGEEFTSNLFTVFREFLSKKKLFNELIERGGKLHVFGDLSELPKDVVEKLNEYSEKEPQEKKIDVNFCLNYGGRMEILRAVRNILEKYPESFWVGEEYFSNHLYTAGQPDPDLIVRTSGEQRLSGFMPWQGIYAELYFTNVLWPDFTPEEFDKALAEYANRERRFGGQG